MDETVIYGLLTGSEGSDKALEFCFDPDIARHCKNRTAVQKTIHETEKRMGYSDYGNISFKEK